jgi:hypothetical protein
MTIYVIDGDEAFTAATKIDGCIDKQKDIPKERIQ